MCILVNRIWEFIQHSQAFLFRKGWPSLYHSLYKTLKITTERSGYKIIKSYHSLNTQQNNYAWVYPLHLLNMDLQECIFIEIGLQHYFSSCSCDLFLLQCSRISWDSGACAVFCCDTNLFLRLCSSPLIYCFVFLIWSNSSWPSFNLLIPFLSLQTHYWSALVSFGFRFLHLF